MKPLVYIISLCLSANATMAQSDVFTYLADFKNDNAYYGFADSAGNPKTLGTFQYVGRPAENLCLVSAGKNSRDDYDNARYGYTTTQGKVVVPLVYHGGESFSEGMAAVKKKTPGQFFSVSKTGYINTAGKEVIPCTYESGGRFSQGLAPVSTGSKNYFFIDKKGEVKIKGPFLDASEFSDGMAGVSVEYDMGSGVKSSKKGFIDLTGKMVVEPVFNYVYPFKDGVAIGSMLEFPKSGPMKSYKVLIDKTGKRLSKEYVDISEHRSENLFAARTTGGSTAAATDEWVFVNLNGKELPFKIIGYGAGFFSEGLLAFVKDKLYGYMDKTGKVVITPKYAAARAFSDGMAAVALTADGPFGYIDRTGKMIIEAKYFSPSQFKEGLASVATHKSSYDKSNLAGVIDKTGKIIIPFGKYSFGEFKNGRAVTEENYVTYYTYKSGKKTLAADPLLILSARAALKNMGENDYAAAAANFKTGADKGYTLSEYYLGYIKVSAQPPLQDIPAGIALMSKAAEKKFPDAMYFMGSLYGTGKGVSLDYAVAENWYSKAEAAGISAASRDLGIMFERGFGRPVDLGKALSYYHKAAGDNDAVALYALGLMYFEGKGVPKNENKGREYIFQASQGGYKPARDFINNPKKIK